MKALNRRPLGLRDWSFIKSSARALSGMSITPNQISIASIGFSAAAAWCLAALPADIVLNSLLTVVFITLRGLCNVFDGMVAIEGGKSTKSGELFNDIPDRISDPLILVAAGYAIGGTDFWPVLGWAAALLAVGTAYVRTLARSMGAPSDFRGPMAKTHRMAVVAVACLLTPFIGPYAMIFGLNVIIFGCIITIWNRARAAYLFLEGKA